MQTTIDFRTIANAALQQAERLLAEWLPDGKRNGHEWKTINPTRHDSASGSFSINIDTGQWADFATDDKGGDLISLYAYLFTTGNQGKAAREIGKRIGIVFDRQDRDSGQHDDKRTPAAMHGHPERRARSPWKPVLPAPAQAGDPPVAHYARGRPEATWCYRSAGGHVLGFVYRFRTSDGGKEILPLCWARHVDTGAEEWRWLAFPTPRPLYGLDRLAARSGGPVLVVEGEKCADAGHAQLANLGWTVVTWPGGSKALGKADWSPLAGLEVVIWPDCDAQRDKTGHLLPEDRQPGMLAAESIGQILAQQDCKVAIVKIPKPGAVAGGWDIADAIADGAAGQALADYIAHNLREPAPATKTVKQSVKVAANDDRPEIKIEKGCLPRLLDEADAALGQLDRTIFAQRERMVRVVVLEAGNSTNLRDIRRRPGAVIIQDVSSAHLRDRLAQVARWLRYDSRAAIWRNADVPRDVSESLISRAGTWKHIPQLHGIAEAPTLRGDGTVLDEPGFDVASGIYLVAKSPPGYRSPPRAPTKADATLALEKLKEAIEEFPFVHAADRSAAVAGILTVLLRRSLPSAPMVGITAPAPGTGKSLLADIFAMIGTGRRAAVLSLGTDHVEGEKRLAAALLSGDSLINLDNIERPLYGDFICQTLSQPTVTIRPLGASAKVTIPTNATFLATGNNLSVMGDLRRRVMLIRLDAGVERPEQRHFQRDVLTWVATHHGCLVTAALTIVRAYIVDDAPGVNCAPFGSFEMWSAWCRQPLIWLGEPDPLRSAEEVRTEDPDAATQRALYAAWWRLYGEKPVTAGKLAQDAQVAGCDSDLHDAVLAACSEHISPRRLGNWLRWHKGRVIDYLRLEQTGMDDHSKIAQWRIVQVAGSAG